MRDAGCGMRDAGCGMRDAGTARPLAIGAQEAGARPASRRAHPASSLRFRQMMPATLHHPYGLDVHELADAEDAELAAVAGALHAAEGDARVRGHHRVDEHLTSLQVIAEALALGGVVRPCTRAESEGGVVCHANRLV